MNPYVDLHSHSTASDGTLAPEEVARLAKRNGVSAWALTDHDTIAGVAAASAEAAALGIDFITGIEFSALFPHPGTLHLLGYGVDPGHPVLVEMNRQLIEARDNRNPRIIARLNELGVSITMAEVEAYAGGEVIGRPHIAAILVRKGYVSSLKQAFNEFLGTTGKAYFDKERLEAVDAIELVRQSGGVTVLAHPIQLRTENDAQLQTVVKGLVDQGLRGIEVIHSDHDASWVEKIDRLADRFGLLKTGGSDFHGGNKHDIDLGTAAGRRVPREWFDAMQKAVGR